MWCSVHTVISMAAKISRNQVNICSHCDKLSQYLWHYPINCSWVINVADQWWCILPVPETVYVSRQLTEMLLHYPQAYLSVVIKNCPTCPTMIDKVHQQGLYVHWCADQPGISCNCPEAKIVMHPYYYLLGDSLEILSEGKSQGCPPEDVVLTSRYKWSCQTLYHFLCGGIR